MRRVVSLFLPTFPTDRLCRARPTLTADAPVDLPLALLGRQQNRRVVMATNQAARANGLRVGMAAARASAALVELIIQDHDPAADAAALERLAIWILERFSPIVAVDGGDGIVIDSTGADHLHGGEAAMLHRLVDRLAGAGITAQAAVADTWGAAHALARHRADPVCVAPRRHGADILKDLPVAALRLAEETRDALSDLGFATIGDLLAAPRAPLVLRFGETLIARLDQASGRRVEPIEPLRPADIIETHRNFAEPIGAAETIARHVGKLVVALCAALEAKGLGVRRLDLVCRRVDNRVEAVRISTARPVRDVARLTRLLCDKIETIAPGFGIERMSLAATLVEPLAPRQKLAALTDEILPDVAGLVDTIANRVGEDRLYRLAPVESDVPERSVRRIAPLAPETGHSWRADWPRPTRLLRRPEPIETMALLPDHPPVAFTWRGVRRRVRTADGPERIFGEWWKRDVERSAVRDYFQVEAEDGERFWIFRAGNGEDAATGSQRWFLHGLFA
ncbi:DNA polymerase Y family protein [Jiella sp. MQZ9-1]|uniref:DNA-directed DNA polymerase n=1 Tax=Jiella flava TaxID=2816857 RepID=A0A939G0V3_9HYPH|nr:DNA polymerase Y family protein [Jiella flava]MBO0664434.1 DNA polymerase Y family protein [Jiella flava]MCD2473070.1 DNA polymerase Y family protein [Jiella flava]